MNRSLRWAARTARLLAGHVGRLRNTLELLRERLREAVVRAVGQSAAGAVQDAVHSLMAQPPVNPDPPNRAFHTRPPSAPWANRDYHDYPSWRDEPVDPYRSLPDDDAEDPAEEESPTAQKASVHRWDLALAVGCQAAAWWLRHKADSFTALKAVGVGLASTLAAYVAGPVLWAGAGLAGSALALAALSDAARYGTAALFGVGNR